MSRYDSLNCPICGKPLNNGDEIVVCPDCGAPYHRTCFKEKGVCIFPELHEKGESWQPPKSKAEENQEKYDGGAVLRCSRCGTINPPYGIFCQVCGNQLGNSSDSDHAAFGQNGQFGPDGEPIPPAGNGSSSYSPNNPYGQPQNGMPRPPFGAPGGPIPPEIPLNPFTTPFGGVAPDEVISDIPAKDLAIFVNRNSHYFLPRFKQIAQNKSKILNWSAFFFHGGYFLYRKMYGLGILVLLLECLLTVPATLITLQGLSGGSSTLITSASTSSLTAISVISTICYFLELALRFSCGLFANTLYFNHCKKKILQEKAIQRSEDEYYAALSKKGSVATKLITGLLIAYAVLYFVCLYILILSGGLL